MPLLFGPQIVDLCFEFVVRRCKRRAHKYAGRNDKRLFGHSGTHRIIVRFVLLESLHVCLFWNVGAEIGRNARFDLQIVPAKIVVEQ